MNQAGTHLIADLYGCRGLDDMALIERTLRAAIEAIGATLIGLHLHPFGEGQGITGVAMLAESHLSIHSWPETGYAAIDLFVCGTGYDLDRGITIIRDALHAVDCRLARIERGRDQELAQDDTSTPMSSFGD